MQKQLQFLLELVLFKETLVIIQMQKQLIFQLQQTIVLKLLKTAVSIFESIFKNGYRYQKAGVMLTGLSNAVIKQIYLLLKKMKK